MQEYNWGCSSSYRNRIYSNNKATTKQERIKNEGLLRATLNSKVLIIQVERESIIQGGLIQHC